MNSGLSRSLPAVFAFCLAFFSVFASSPATAQDDSDLATRASAAIAAAEWVEALKLYSELTTLEPDNAVAWYRRGLSTMRAEGDTSAGRSAFEKALELGFSPQFALFGVAKSHVVDGDFKAAMRTLERLAAEGPSPLVVSAMASDELFDQFSSNQRFQEIVKSLTPCMSAEYRQFDFWIGKWIVKNPSGQVVGTNTVAESMDGCLLTENWESAAGGQKGTSMNYYDRDTGTWSQIYRDNSGNITQWPELKGGLVDGAMVLDSGPDTQPRSRWTWSMEDGGRVRQMAENSTDGGDTWTVVWDSYYNPVKN